MSAPNARRLPRILRAEGRDRGPAAANALEELDKVTVAAVDGFAVGGGLEITMACDFVCHSSCVLGASKYAVPRT